VPRACAKRTRVEILGSRLPASIRETSVMWTPEAWPTCSCVRPARTRAARTFCPMRSASVATPQAHRAAHKSSIGKITSSVTLPAWASRCRGASTARDVSGTSQVRSPPPRPGSRPDSSRACSPWRFLADTTARTVVGRWFLPRPAASSRATSADQGETLWATGGNLVRPRRKPC
jgi:hypothetical protein